MNPQPIVHHSGKLVTGMIVAQSLLFIILLSILLVKSASLMITSSSKIARHFKISEYTVSFLVIAFATSLPELMVGIVSALDGKPSLSYGNVLGSNIADLTIILAIPILVGGAIATQEIVRNKDLIHTAFFGVLPLILMLDGVLSKFDGLGLLVSYFFYLFLVLRRSSVSESIAQNFVKTNVLKNLLFFLFSVVLLLISSDLLVKVAENLSIAAGLPIIFVGLTLTAVGTSLPELTFGLKAIKTHHKGEVLGNIVGSVVANSTLVLGVTAILSPILANGDIGMSSVGFLILTLALFLIFGFRKKLGKTEALIFLALYIIFILTEQLFLV